MKLLVLPVHILKIHDLLNVVLSDATPFSCTEFKNNICVVANTILFIK